MGRKKKKFVVSAVEFTGIADKGSCVGRDAEGRVLFVNEVAPGDVADVLVLRKEKNYFRGVPVEFHKYSPDRTDPFCEHFGICGGCKWQHITYEAQIHHKEKVVREVIQRIGKVTPGEFLPIVGAKEQVYYRNKLEFTFCNKRWLTKEEINSDVSNLENVLGFHRPGAFDKIVNITHCWLQSDPSNDLRNGVREIALEQSLTFYDVKAHEGLLRNMMMRITTLGEILVVFSFSSYEEKLIPPFLDAILARFPAITTLGFCVNTKMNDFMLDLEIDIYSGKGYIEEQLNHVRFRIGPKSFFQTNTRQAEVLYDIVADFANLTGKENVYDLYTGIGSIALYVAKDCHQVVGIEEIPEAIADAKINAALNEIENTVFYAGDVKDILTDEFAEKHGRPDVLITDPPRAGMHKKVVEMLLELATPKIVYVSCNPATQARDLALLSSAYDLVKIQPVDMFPQTYHVESVALLALKQ